MLYTQIVKTLSKQSPINLYSLKADYEEKLEQVIPTYREALQKAGHNYNLQYKPKTNNKNSNSNSNSISNKHKKRRG